MFKGTIDKVAKKKARDIMLKAAAEEGFDVASRMTPAIDQKLDELLQTIIDEIGYTELAKMGIKL